MLLAVADNGRLHLFSSHYVVVTSDQQYYDLPLMNYGGQICARGRRPQLDGLFVDMYSAMETEMR